MQSLVSSPKKFSPLLTINLSFSLTSSNVVEPAWFGQYLSARCGKTSWARQCCSVPLKIWGMIRRPLMAAQKSFQKHATGMVAIAFGAVALFGTASFTAGSHSPAYAENYRSGVVLNGSHYGKQILKRQSDLGLIERRRAIEARNDRIAFQNAERRARNAAKANRAGVLVLDVERQGILTADVGGVAGNVYTQTNPCPRSHNCGYRVYSDGSGPRIITLGVNPGGDLPEFDGLSGPLVITLD